MSAPPPDRHVNNFDLIRLTAAVQVVVGHGLLHLGLLPLAPAAAVRALHLFDGVPIFFVVSGFLVTGSLERSRSLGDYAWKRFLRIYPALWVCFGVTLLLLGASGALTSAFMRTTFAPWVVAQLTVVQYFNPDALRSFGIGVANGSLWTIPVEIGFYVLLPLTVGGIARGRLSRRAGTVAIGIIAALAFALWVWADTSRTLLHRLVLVTPFPHFWMFLYGSLAYRYRDRLMPLVRGRFLWWLSAYVAIALLMPGIGPQSALTFAVLAGVVLSAAFTAPTLATRLLRGNDISYGVYIYHMLGVNLLVVLGMRGDWGALALALAAALMMATLSWRLVERPALRLKSRVWRGACGHAPIPARGIMVTHSPVHPSSPRSTES